MRRYTENELLKRRITTYIISALLLVIAVIIPFLPDIFPLPSYDELRKTEVTVKELEKYHIYRGGYDYRICTDDGEVYNLNGDYEYEEIKDVLVSGAKATVKWYNGLMGLRYCAEEITVDGRVVVAYDNDEPVKRGGLFFLSSVVVLFAVLYLVFSLLWTRHIQRLQNMRDKRIEKKYKKYKE